MLQTADVCIVMSLDSSEVIRRPEDSFLMLSKMPTTIGVRKMLLEAMLSKMPTDGVRKMVVFLCAHMRCIYVHMSPGGNTDARNMLFYNSSSTTNQISNFHK